MKFKLKFKNMKTNMLNWKAFLMGILVAGTFTACNGNNQNEETVGDNAAVDAVAEPVPTPVGDVEAMTQDAEGQQGLLAEYMDVKNALFNDNFENAKQEARDLQQQLSSLETETLNEQQKQEVQNSIQEMVNAKDIESLRQSFAILSRQLYSLAHGKELTNKTLYWQQCPMALNNTGANWLSFEKEIQNPYMGQSMPKCGSLKETINN